MLPLQIGMPGTQEMFVLLFVIAFYGGLAVLAVKVYNRLFGNTENVDELRDRVALLEHQVAELEDELNEE